MSEGSQALKVTLCVQKNWWSLSKHIEKPQSMDSIVIMHGDSSSLMNDSLICYNVMFRPNSSYLSSVRLHVIAEDLWYEKQKRPFLSENSASICWMRALSDALNEGTGQSQSRFLPGRKIYSIQKNSKYLFNPKLQYLWTAHKGRAF